jgi:hypothetical protein
VFHGVDVSARELAALQHAERHAYQAGDRRGVWICPAIVRLYPDFLPDASLLTRSDWPLDLRLVLEESGAVRQLWVLKQLCGMVLAALEGRALRAEPLIQQVVRRSELLLPTGIVEARLRDVREEERLATDAPASDARDRFEVFRTVAEDAFEQLASVDGEARSKIAEKLAHASPEVQLFGMQNE